MARTRFTSALRLGAAVAALSLAAPALAQEDPGAQGPEDTPGAGDELVSPEEVTETTGDIVVTARRREESLRDVPISVTAYTGEALEAQGALDITDIADTTPNVTLEASRGTNSTLTAFIRGVGQQDPVAGFEAGVGIYIDDVYLNRPQAALLDIYDVERIEILRGPQGTLYGRNTIGGAVKYVTRRLPDEFDLRIRGTLGTYEQADLVVSASTPVGSGALKFGAALARLSRGGFGDNLTTGLENYNRDIWAGRISAEAEGEQIFVRLSADYTQDDSNPRGGHRLIPGLVSGAPVLDDVFDSRGGLLEPEQKVKAGGVTLFGELELTDEFTIRSITAYREDESGTPIDFDALPMIDVDVPAIYENKQLSQELQLLYDSGPFNLLLGGYFLDADSVTIFDVRLPGTVTALTAGDVETETFAVFGDATYDFSEQFSISLGGRYTWDERTSEIDRNLYIGGGSPFFGGTGSLLVPQTDFRGSATFKEFTPRASVSFKPTPDHNIYASYSKGFKGGGFDPRGVATACRTPTGGTCNADQLFDFLSFEPETVDSYEIGWKATLLDRRLNFALAAFRADYEDVQVPGSVGTVVNGQQTFIGITTNAGKARFQGIEFEGNLRVGEDLAAAGDRLSLAASFGYIDAEYREFIDARGIDVADRREIQNTPKYTASGTLNYGFPIGPGRLSAITTLSYRSKVSQFELPNPLLDQEGFALWDASLVWNSDDDRYSIGLHAKNITDKEYITSGYSFLFQNPDTARFEGNGVGPGLPLGVPGFDSTLGNQGILTAYYGNPRQVFVTFGLNF